jgi:tetratricopeptide (TPR) repeat protein
MPALVHEPYPPQLLAQKLINRGAICIETGRFELAISTLVKALKLSEQVANDYACSCRHCSLEESMSINQTVPRLMRQDSPSFCRHEDACTSPTMARLQQTEDSEQDGYIYRRAIRVSQFSMQEGHSMGATMSLIIIFNLALAHHLSAIQQQMCRRRLQKALQFYELAYHLQSEEQSSLRFTMIIANNLGEIHRAVNNHSKHVMCLQHLLSTMMYLVDCQIPADSIELDGFFRNTSQLILNNKCASAA